MGMAVQRILRGVASHPRGQSKGLSIVAICKPAFSELWGWLKRPRKLPIVRFVWSYWQIFIYVDASPE